MKLLRKPYVLVGSFVLLKKMMKYGLKKIEAAKKNGMWNKLSTGYNKDEMPKEFKEKLKSHEEAARNFNNLPPSYKKKLYSMGRFCKER